MSNTDSINLIRCCYRRKTAFEIVLYSKEFQGNTNYHPFYIFEFTHQHLDQNQRNVECEILNGKWTHCVECTCSTQLQCDIHFHITIGICFCLISFHSRKEEGKISIFVWYTKNLGQKYDEWVQTGFKNRKLDWFRLIDSLGNIYEWCQPIFAGFSPPRSLFWLILYLDQKIRQIC